MKKTIVLTALFAVLAMLPTTVMALGDMEGSSSGKKSDFDYGMKMETTWSSNPDYHWHESVDRHIRKDVAPHSGSPCTVCAYACNANCLLPGQRGPAGGIIFYHNHKGFTVQGYGTPGTPGYFASYTAYYLEAAPANERHGLEWGNFVEPGVIGADLSSFGEKNGLAARAVIGNGRRDTQLIIAYHTRAGLRIARPANGYAAKVCADKRLNSFSDWFLPSFGELWHLYKTRGQTEGLLEFGEYPALWSSTAMGEGGAWFQYMRAVGQNPEPTWNLRNNNGEMIWMGTRAIRAF